MNFSFRPTSNHETTNPFDRHSSHESNPISKFLSSLNGFNGSKHNGHGPDAHGSQHRHHGHNDHHNHPDHPNHPNHPNHETGSGHGDSDIEISLLGTFNSGLGEGAAEIVAHDPETQRLFVTNAEDKSVDILDISDPKHPTKIGSIDVGEIGGEATGGPNSVAVAKGIVAVAVEADDVTDPGLVAFYDADGNFLGSVAVGSLPDMLTFTPDGKKLIVANEGEPDGGVDPKGSVSIIDLSAGVGAATVTTVDFTAFDAQQAALEADGLRVFPGKLLSDDVEPEYIAISEDGKTAFITLQEANAVAVLDIATATIVEIQPLGAKDYAKDGNGLDASDRDDGINIQTWPLFGLYMPDAIASYDYKGKTYYVTANEGDDRGEDERIKDLILDPTAFPDADTLQEDENIGRLAVSTIDGDIDGDGDYDRLYAYGARSFSIWDENGNLVFDSGDMIEQITAELTPDLFNADDGDPGAFDTRSDAKGPEPEAVVVGEVDGRTYAFVGLERAGGGVMVFDVTKPTKVEFVQYIRTEGDVAPEGLDFIPAKDSPIGVPLLAVANEVSGTTSLYQINFEGKTIKGSDCDDVLKGTAGDDDIAGNKGDDIIKAGPGNDVVSGGPGNDDMDGGPGDDTVDYSDSKYGVNVNLAAGSATTVMTNKGHITSEASMFDGENGYKALPILTIGETLEDTSGALNGSTAGDYTPVGVLDGIGAYALDHKTVRVFVNHELQHNRGNAYEVSDGQGGSFSMTGARISYYDIDKNTKAIVDGGIAYDKIVDANGDVASDISFLTEGFAGFSRFCSGVLFECNQFGHGRGTVDTIYFAGEEDGGSFNPVGGAEWALDVETGTLYQLPALGRGAWENVTQLDTGTRTHVAFILADDTSPFNADGDAADEAAPLYLYIGEKVKGSDDFLARNGLSGGKLYVWVPGDSSADSPLEFNGAGSTLDGSWVALDNARDPGQASEDGSTGYDEYGYPTQRNLWTQAEALGAFQFSRPEDVATNPKSGRGNEFVLASTGVDTFDVDPGTGNGADTFGTVYTMKIDFSDIDNPAGRLKILYDGDEDTDRALRSPDNLDWADDGYIYVQEDRAEFDSLTGERLFGDGAANPNEASIVRIDPRTGEITRVGQIDRGAVVPGGTSDVDAGDVGAWESSGVLDVSRLFGEKPGSLFLFDVQAHGIADQEGVPGSGGRIVDGDLVEGGQLLLLAAPHVDISQKVEVDTLANFENVIGSKKDDVLIGDDEDNVLDGNKGDDAIFGGGGDDTQIGGKGDDSHDGGAGEDTAVFSGNSEDYDIVFNDGVVTVTDLRGGSPDGTDTLYNMEKAQFANETISLIEEQTFTLQILHASDLEGGVDAIDRAANFAAIVDALEDEYENSITLSAGDNFIPSPFFNAAGDAATFDRLFEGFYNAFFGLIDTSVVDPSADTNGDGFYDNDELDAFIQANAGISASDVYVVDINGDGYPDYFDEIDNHEGRADISIMNIIGFDASALGNHEFDFGSDALENIINYDSEEGNSLSGVGVGSIIDEFGSGAVNYLQEVDWPGAQFPYLSSNIDFSADDDLGSLFTTDILLNTDFRSDLLSARNNPADPAETAPDSNDKKIARATIIQEGGEFIGVVGATTQLLDALSSPTGANIIGRPFLDNDLPQLASLLQPIIDDLIAGDAASGRPPVNKIILTTHLQQLSLETELAGLLHGVDVIIAGGSDTILADETDHLRAGDTAAGDYPVQTVDADGNPVLIVSTDGEYSYVGRLVVEFDSEGHIITSSLDENVNGAYATDEEGVLAVTGATDLETAIADSKKATDVEKITDAVQGVVIATDSNVFGETDVFLDGVRTSVRTEETNMGDLTADANLAVAQSIDDTVLVSIKNGGGIRAPIGEVDYDGNELPPPENPLSGKEAGEISQLDIENSLRFNNGLTLITLTPEQLLQVLEHAVAATAPGATPGQFAQVGGISFSFDPDQPAGSRVQSAALLDALGNKIAIVQNGEVIDGAPSAIRIVTLNFLADGGDNYPFPAFIAADPAFADRVDLADLDPSLFSGALDGNADFAGFGTEQDALAEFLAANHPAVTGPDGPNDYAQAETDPTGDTRIQNLSARTDTVLDGATFPGEGAVVINEIRIDQPGTDNDEYFELFGDANTSLDGLTYLVIGDGTGGSGVIEEVTDLAGYALDGDGFFLVAESTFGLGTADLVTSLNFENSDNVTHLLVRGFTGTDGLDLDTDDDGVLDVMPWDEVIDSVALITPSAPPAGDQVYSTTQVGPDGSFVPGHVFRSPDGGDWQVGTFDPPGATDTPGSENLVFVNAAIYDIQGAGHRSPLEGNLVRTSGIVTAITFAGFYIQDPNGDGDIATSDGIFVLGDTAGIAVGDEVQVEGTVQELQFGSDLSVTRIAASNSNVLSSGNALPETVVLGDDRIQPDDVIDDDGLTSFDPTTDAIDFLESLEGMRVEVDDPLVVAGTNRFGEVALAAGRAGEFGSTNVNAVISEGDFNPEILLTDDVIVTAPDATTGDIFATDAVGVLDYTFGAYKLQLTQVPVVVSGGRTAETTALSGDGTHMTIATYNVLNLDPNDTDGDTDIAAGRFASIAESIVNNLGAPDILALQEIQDNSGGIDDGTVDADLTLQMLVDAIFTASGGTLTYGFAYIAPADNEDGGQPGANIQNAFLYNTDRVQLDALSKLTDDAFNEGGDGTAIEANYEGTRKPLIGEFTFLPTGETVTVIGNHLKSKSQDDGLYGENQPPFESTLTQRVDQASVINDFVANLLSSSPDANVIVLGDMNDFQFSDTLDALKNGNGMNELINLVDNLPFADQYSFIFNGNSQLLDHILVSDNIADNMPEIDAVHLNLDFGFPSDNPSDHDPIVARVDLSDHPAVL